MVGPFISSLELSKRVQSLLMSVHDYDFFIGSDVIYIVKRGESGFKVESKLACLTVHMHSQRTNHRPKMQRQNSSI